MSDLHSLRQALTTFIEATETQSQGHIRPLHWHIAYPTLVYGFLHVIKANREADVEVRNDIAIHASGAVTAGILRYHDAMVRLSGRRDVRDDVSRYESVGLAMVSTVGRDRGEVLASYPPAGSPLTFEGFFPRLYESYDLRYVYAAPALEDKTRRLEWASDSLVIATAESAGFQPRLASDR